MKDKAQKDEPNKTIAKKKSAHVRIAYFLVASSCTIGFAIGSWQSWVKFRHEPTSLTSDEVRASDLTLPSVTVCPYTSQLIHFGDNSDWSLEKAVEGMGMIPISITQGY